MTEEMKQIYLKKLSYEEWEQKIFENIKSRFYIHNISKDDTGVRLYFVRDFTVFVSSFHFDFWYNRYLNTTYTLIEIEQTVNELDNIITKGWMKEIRKENE